jgi:hypothetical protein
MDPRASPWHAMAMAVTCTPFTCACAQVNAEHRFVHANQLQVTRGEAQLLLRVHVLLLDPNIVMAFVHVIK